MRIHTIEMFAAGLAMLALVSGCGRGEDPKEESSRLVASPAPVAQEAPAGDEPPIVADAVEPVPQIHLSGEIFLRERITLPRDASLLVRLVELEAGGQVGVEVAMAEVSAVSKQPIPFELSVEKASVQSGVAYGLTAVISRRGARVFSTDGPVRVLEPGSQTTGLRLLLRRGE